VSTLQLIFDLIDMRSFSNLWYWIALAVFWSSTSHWVLGVPFDLVLRARRRGGAAADDLRDLLRINTTRLLLIWREAGLALTLAGSFVLSALATLGFAYAVEFCQAVLLLLAPMTLVTAMSLRAARRISALLAAADTSPEMLVATLTRHRLKVQLIGMLSITITAFWGMLQNFNLSVLG
jgi:hypothetical protein